jgi:adenosylhomocysteinase
MDMSFANQILGLEYLVKHPIYFEDDKVYNMPVEIDRRVAELKLQTLGIEIDKETEEQIKYRRS